MNFEFERLPKSVIPTRYDLTLKVDLDSKEFHGKLTIDIDVTVATRSIAMNCRDLSVTSACVNGKEFAEILYDHNVERVSMNFPVDIPVSKSVLYLEYEGKLSQSMKGFYYCSYTNADGAREIMAVTHFEPTQARYAFPCWDEPSFRSQFRISIETDKRFVAVSNMPIEQSRITDHTVIHEFQTTPSMPSYLVAFAVGDFERKSIPGNDYFGLWCLKGTEDDRAQFALRVATGAMKWYENWFGLTHALPKLDLLAVPDSVCGGMENWGLVTFRESLILINEEECSVLVKQRISLLISHELAHMWFGNLVTLDWWTDLWLKEGFAKWMEYFCVDHCFPQFEIWNQFSSNEYLRTMSLDSMISTHPIEVEVKSPQEISEIFDAISYCKGASVIRVLVDFLKEKDFQTGLKKYLYTYQFKSTKTEDLWNSLQQCTDKPVKDVMNSWTRQSGYPIVTVEVIFSRSENKIDSVKLTQERFLQSGEKSSESTLWHIPITIVNSDNPKEELLRFVMDSKEKTIDFTKLNKNYHCIFMNPSGIGIYRVYYQDQIVLNILKSCLSLESWSSNDKFSLLEDCFALTNAGKMAYGDVLNMLDFMANEKSFTIWELVASNLKDIHNLLDESIYGVSELDKFILNLAIHHYKRLGWKESSSDDANDIQLRRIIISLMALVNYSEVIEKSKDIFIDLMNDKGKAYVNIRQIVYICVGKNAFEKDYDLLTERYANCQNGIEQTEIINSLGKITLDLQDKFIKWILSDNVRKQDRINGFISSASRSCKHRELIWTVIQKHWKQLTDMYSGQFLISGLLKECLSGFCSLEKAVEIKTFFDSNDSTTPRTVKQVIEKIESNNRRLNLHSKVLHEFLTQKHF